MRKFDKQTKKQIDDVISNLASLAGVNANRLNKFISNISSENYEDEGDVVNDSYIGNVIKYGSEYIYVKSVNLAHNGLYKISGRSLRIEDYDGKFNLSISNGTTKYVQESVIANNTLNIISDEEFVKDLMKYRGIDPVSLYEVLCEVQVISTLDENVEELPEETPVEDEVVEEETTVETPVEDEVVEEETPVETPVEDEVVEEETPVVEEETPLETPVEEEVVEEETPLETPVVEEETPEVEETPEE